MRIDELVEDAKPSLAILAVAILGLLAYKGGMTVVRRLHNEPDEEKAARLENALRAAV
ncbi:MAG: hypothetical protein AAB375_00835 [Patescibacteria group bacterium]